MKSFTERVLEMAVTIVVAAILLNIAWTQFIVPMLPVLLIAGAIYVVARYAAHRRRYW